MPNGIGGLRCVDCADKWNPSNQSDYIRRVYGCLNIVAPQFEQTTGIVLVADYGASSGRAPDSLPSRLSKGEAADVIILSRSSLDMLTELGQVRPASRFDVVCSRIGMAVRSGAPKPDINTRDAFIHTVIVNAGRKLHINGG